MDKFESKKLAIIGGGHIGLALVEGLINSGKITGSQLIVANPSLSKIAHLKNQGVEIILDNKTAAGKADWIFLAVKPFVVRQVMTEISSSAKGKLIISLAAVVTIDNIRRQIKNNSVEIIRIMPNMAISCNQGVIGMFTKEIPKGDRRQMKELFSKLGLVIEVNNEKSLDVITILSGCGPALVSKFMEILANYGIEIGLSSDESHKLILQTLKGTVALLEKKGIFPYELVRSVATKSGITEAILNKIVKEGLQTSFIKAMNSGYTKVKELDQALNNGLEVTSNGNN